MLLLWILSFHDCNCLCSINSITLIYRQTSSNEQSFVKSRSFGMHHVCRYGRILLAHPCEPTLKYDYLLEWLFTNDSFHFVILLQWMCVYCLPILIRKHVVAFASMHATLMFFVSHIITNYGMLMLNITISTIMNVEVVFILFHAYCFLTVPHCNNLLVTYVYHRSLGDTSHPLDSSTQVPP